MITFVVVAAALCGSAIAAWLLLTVAVETAERADLLRRQAEDAYRGLP